MADVQLAPYLEQLRQLAPLRAVTIVHDRRLAAVSARTDGLLELRTARSTHRLVVEHKARALSPETAAAVAAPARGAATPLLVMSPLVAGDAARRLRERGINYIDLAGNCHLRLGDDLYVHVEGQRPPPVAPEDRGIRAAGFQVLFTYLAGADLDLPVRTVAQLAGVSHHAAHQMRARLLAEGFLHSTRGHLRWNPRRLRDALDRWIHGYLTAVRPRLYVGTYRTRARGPDETAAMLLSSAGAPGPRWRWGGTAAAYELTRYYRGERTVVHVREDEHAFVRQLPVLPDVDGTLVVMRAFGDITWPALHHATVDPLLVYSELLVGDDDRSREAAAELFDEHVRSRWSTDVQA